ncbi:MAG: hypothetical protein GW809_00660 [Bacteroidetes bacterium]|nr:hypothetical protein [Bacteroidota bacterium]
MGKVGNGSNVSGKIGPVEYYTRNGKELVRSAPVLASKRTRKRKETLPQKMTRMRFKWAFHMIGEIRQHIDELYQEIKGKESPFHKTVGRIVKTTLRGNEPETLEFDFEMLPVAHGSLVFPARFQKNLLETDETKQIELSWDAGLGDSEDTLSFLAFWLSPKTSKKEEPDSLFLSRLIHTKTKRKEAKYVIDISALPDREALKDLPMCVYVYFKNKDKKLNSDSVCVFRFGWGVIVFLVIVLNWNLI